MILLDLVMRKGRGVQVIGPDATVGEAVQQLVAHNIGSLLVTEAGAGRKLLGIFTERDLLRLLAARPDDWRSLRVGDQMTRGVVLGRPSDTVSTAMGLMTRHRVRHLPIVDDDGILGIVSIGDLVKGELDALALENHHLREYLQQA